MATAVFVDTNVLVYASDVSNELKHRRAIDVLAALDPLLTYVSAQVLAEYAHVVTHPAKRPLPPADVLVTVRRFAEAWTVMPIDAETVIAALEAKARWGFAYYDAQIWAAASFAGVDVVLSEDFSSGTTFGGVRCIDPFAVDFDPAAL